MLRVLSKICSVLGWGVAIVGGGLIQLLVLFAFISNWTQEGRPLMFVLALLATLSFWAGIVLRKRFPKIGWGLLIAGSVLFIVAAIVIRRTILPNGNVTVKANGEVALDELKILWRHYLPVLAPILLGLGELLKHRHADKKEMQDAIKEVRSKKVALQTLDVHLPE